MSRGIDGVAMQPVPLPNPHDLAPPTSSALDEPYVYHSQALSRLPPPPHTHTLGAYVELIVELIIALIVELIIELVVAVSKTFFSTSHSASMKFFSST